jgi:hypothetical protein
MDATKSSKRKDAHAGSKEKYMPKLESLLREVGKIDVAVDKLKETRVEKAADVHELVERNRLAETRGVVIIYAPFKTSNVVVPTKSGNYQIQTYTTAEITDEKGAEHLFKELKIRKNMTHKTVIDITPMVELIKKGNKRYKEHFDALVEAGVAQTATVKKITALGKKRAEKFKKGRNG